MSLQELRDMGIKSSTSATNMGLMDGANKDGRRRRNSDDNDRVATMSR